MLMLWFTPKAFKRKRLLGNERIKWGFKAQASRLASVSKRHKSILQNWFGLELKPRRRKRLQHREVSLPEGTQQGAPFPCEVYSSPELSSLSTYHSHKNHRTETPAG